MSFEQAAPTCRIKHTTQTWGTGMTVDLTITNTGTTPINGWTLTFSMSRGQTIISDWNTDLTQGGDIVTAVNAAYNGSIAPGRSVTMGYLASHTGDASLPTRFSLNGDTCAAGS